MVTMLLRSHDCLKNRVPADGFRSSFSAKSQTGPPPCQTKLPAETGARPGFRPASSQTKPSDGRNNRGGCAAPVRPCHRRRTPERRRQMVVKLPVKELVMEEVTILKRGQRVGAPPQAAEDREPLGREENAAAAEAAGGDEVELCSTSMVGLDPEILPKQFRLMDQKPHMYAGSGFLTSPPPSSLPLPTSFFAKKDVADTGDLAARSLRCLLRVDLL